MANRITTLLSLDAQDFDSKLKRLRTEVARAEGAMGKAKVLAGGLGDAIKENLAASAVAAGTALIAFGVKSVQAFQDTALAAGQFSDATGIAVEDASRLLEVAGDLGIEAGTIQGAFMRLNKAIADGKKPLDEFGVEVVRTKDGVVDANATFKNAITTIGAIEDPTKRAKAAQELFGRSYGQVSELMSMSAEQLERALAGVSDQKVINEAELRRAREFRNSMDELRDRVDDLTLAAGGELVKSLTTVAKTVGFVADNIDELGQLMGGATGGLVDWGGVVKSLATGPLLNAIDAVDDLNEITGTLVVTAEQAAEMQEEFGSAADTGATAAERAARATEALKDAQRRARDAVSELKSELDKLTGKLSQEEAFLNLSQQFDDVVRSAYDVQLAINEGTLTAEEGMRRQALAINDVKQSVIDYVDELGNVPAEKVTEYLALIDEGSYEEVERRLAILTRNRNYQVTFTAVSGGDTYNPGTGAGRGQPLPRFDDGGVMPGPRGKHSLAWVAGGETVLPTHKPGGATMGGSNYYITLNQANMTPDQLVEAIKRWERRNGPLR